MGRKENKGREEEELDREGGGENNSHHLFILVGYRLYRSLCANIHTTTHYYSNSLSPFTSKTLTTKPKTLQRKTNHWTHAYSCIIVS